MFHKSILVPTYFLFRYLLNDIISFAERNLFCATRSKKPKTVLHTWPLHVQNNNKYTGDITQLYLNKILTKLTRNTRVTSQTQQLKHMLILVLGVFVLHYRDWPR